MKRRDAEEMAYRWLGSHPCECCEFFRKCDEEDHRCDEAKEYNAKYDKLVEEYLHRF